MSGEKYWADNVVEVVPVAGPLGMGGPPCILSLSRRGDDLLIDDQLSCRKYYCGARGGLNVAFPFKSRRPIHYLKKLTASSEYKEAIRHWRDQREQNKNTP